MLSDSIKGQHHLIKESTYQQAMTLSGVKVNFVATMSAGKSTVINALLGKRLLPSGNEATTAKVLSIFNQGNRRTFGGSALDDTNQVIEAKNYVDLRRLQSWNKDTTEIGKQVASIQLYGHVPFIHQGAPVVLVDTPGPNNSQDKRHEERVNQLIVGQQNALFVYIMNATQLKTNDDKEFLTAIMQAHLFDNNKFIFVVNKIDTFEADENVQATIDGVVQYLQHDFGIKRPTVIGVSALTALEARTTLADLSNVEMTRVSRRDPRANAIGDVFETINAEDKYLEQVAQVPTGVLKAATRSLKRVIRQSNYKRQAVIYSGLTVLEECICYYVQQLSSK